MIFIASRCRPAIPYCLPPTVFTNCAELTTMTLAGRKWRKSGANVANHRQTNRCNACCKEQRILPSAESSMTTSPRWRSRFLSFNEFPLLHDFNIQFDALSILNRECAHWIRHVFSRRENEVRHVRVVGLFDVARRGFVIAIWMRMIDSHQLERRFPDFAQMLK